MGIVDPLQNEIELFLQMQNDNINANNGITPFEEHEYWHREASDESFWL